MIFDSAFTRTANAEMGVKRITVSILGKIEQGRRASWDTEPRSAPMIKHSGLVNRRCDQGTEGMSPWGTLPATDCR